ncbi:Rpn family recombination-promoting nuclease/putative transposase [Sporosarcina sp. NPDC096371]|uniref:Rpn family recombination-promoting nuclease/putative transposase n=1 Tax=Sporosarcina sp. NPDC096371 TaxID=3364530 RepID=UPI00380AE3A9
MVALVREKTEKYRKKLLDVRNDLVFKAIFGEERNEDLLLLLLNAILKEDVVKITFLDTHMGADFVDEKYSVMDIRVRTAKNAEINIEMQLEHHDGFENRMLLYWARLYAKQLKSGQAYTQLRKAIQISIVDFKFLQNEHYHSTFQLEEQEKRIKFTDHLEIHVLELPKVRLNSSLEDKNALKKWMLFISGDDHTKEELAMSDLGIGRAYNELQRISEDEVMQERVIAREKYLSDQATRRELAKEEGKKELREEAILAMHHDGLPIEAIARYMKISVEQVGSVINPLQ